MSKPYLYDPMDQDRGGHRIADLQRRRRMSFFDLAFETEVQNTIFRRCVVVLVYWRLQWEAQLGNTLPRAVVKEFVADQPVREARPEKDVKRRNSPQTEQGLLEVRRVEGVIWRCGQVDAAQLDGVDLQIRSRKCK